MNKYVRILLLSSFLGFTVSCSSESKDSSTKAIDFGDQNVNYKAPYVVGKATMKYNEEESQGLADLKEIEIAFLWDQYSGKMQIHYLNIEAPSDEDVPSHISSEHSYDDGNSDREWRVDINETQQLAIYNLSDELPRSVSESGEVGFESIDGMRTTVSLFVNYNGISLGYDDHNPELGFYERKYDADDALALFLENDDGQDLETRFQKADQLFSQRETMAIEAREAYKKAAMEASDEEKVYAYSQIARLDYYRGAIALPDPEDQSTYTQEIKKIKYAIFSECLEDLKEIADINEDVFLTYRLMCSTFQVQNASTLQRARNLRAFKSLLDNVENKMESDELNILLEGNILRYLAAVRISRDGARYGLYDEKTALDIVNSLFVSPTSHYDVGFKSFMSASDYYENYYIAADVLCREEIGQKDKALEIINLGLFNIEKFGMTSTRKPEALRQKERLLRLRETINNL